MLFQWVSAHISGINIGAPIEWPCTIEIAWADLG